MDSSVYAILGMIIYVIFAWPYIRSLWKKDVIFHPYSWLLWVILGSINAYALWNQDNIWSFIAQALSIIFWCIFCIYGFVTSKKLSLNWIDSFCIWSGIIALIIFMIFWLTKAIIAIIFVDIIAIIPTWKKIYINPKSDKIIPWFWSIATLSLYLISIENWTFESTTFWIYLILVNTMTWFYLVYRKIFDKN
jgi:hypothetical protein